MKQTGPPFSPGLPDNLPMRNVAQSAGVKAEPASFAADVSHYDAPQRGLRPGWDINAAPNAATSDHEFLHSLLMAIPVPLSVVAGHDPVYQLENHAHAALTGFRPIVGRPLREAFPKLASWMLPIVDEVYRSGQPQHLDGKEIRYPDDHAPPGYFSICWQPLHAADNKPHSIIITMTDITDRVGTQEKLAQGEARYRHLFESIDEGFCIIEMLYDQAGRAIDYRFCEINPVFEQQTGLRDAVGRTIREMAPGHEEHWFTIYDEVARTGNPIRFENEARSLNRWFDVYAFRIDEARGPKVAVLFKDITDRRRVEAQLRLSERRARAAARQADAERRRLDAVLESAPVGILVADAKGAVVHTNPENQRLWGAARHPATKLDEFKAWKGWWADDSQRHTRPLRPEEWPVAAALRGERRRDIIEVESLDDPPVRRVVLISGAPICDSEGNVGGGVVALMDISDRIKAEKALRETAERLQFTLDSAQIGDWSLDFVNNKAHRSPRHDQCFGYSEPLSNWSLERFFAHVHPQDRTWVRDAFEAACKNFRDWHLECRVIWPDGSVHWIAAHGSVYESNGKLGRMAGIVYDVTDRKQAEEKVRHASLHDALTGLPNRAMLFESASHLFSSSRRTGQSAAVLFIDLDRFKPINDIHGHEVGDLVLEMVAERLVASVSAEDIVARLGGDEFVILVQQINDTAYAGEVARHVCDVIGEPYLIGELALSLSTSIGISVFPSDGQNIDTLISHADMAMYQAKQAGRNTYHFYNAESAAGTKLQSAIEQRLKSALRTGAFRLVYQPVVDIDTRALVSVEALLRWQHNEIGPAQFVPVAEATGTINSIGHWLLDEASRQHKRWQAQGLPPIPIAINVSVVEFRDHDFVHRFNAALRRHGIGAGALQLELTETAVMNDLEHASATLAELQALGVTVLLDDFGTGHSSLAYLARLPLNKVKIDKSFISRLEYDVTSKAVTEAMIALGRTLNLDVVAEGIESELTMDYLCARGCTQAQGFFVAEPMAGEAFEVWYRQQASQERQREPDPARRR